MPKQPCKKSKPLPQSITAKTQLVKRLAALLPPHEVYVEPFSSKIQLIWAKPSAEQLDLIGRPAEERFGAYRTFNSLNPWERENMALRIWRGDKRIFYNLARSAPDTKVDQLYRYLYLDQFGFDGKDGIAFNPRNLGRCSDVVSRIEKLGNRIRDLNFTSLDFGEVITWRDNEETVFFLDLSNPEAPSIDATEFFLTLKSLKGKFLAVYDKRSIWAKLFKDSGFFTKTISIQRTFGRLRGKPTDFTTCRVAANYPLKKTAETRTPVTKSASADQEPAASAGTGFELLSFQKSIPILKGTKPDDERYVLGIVLEPETVDAQNEIYSRAEIRYVAHKFLEEFGGLGLQHRFRINDKVKILESYLAPEELTVADKKIQKGTWLLAVRVLDDGLWQLIQDGKLTGFSMGGSAVKQELGDGVSRLRDMIVQEISLVDHAANKHRFLIAKRSNELIKTNDIKEPVQKNAEGGDAAAPDASEQEATAESGAQDETPPAATEPEAAGQEAPTAEGGESSPDASAQLNEVVEGLKTISQSLADALKISAPKTEDEEKNQANEEPQPESMQKDDLTAIAGQLSEIMTSLQATLQPVTTLVGGLTAKATEDKPQKTEKQQLAANPADRQVGALVTAVNSLADMLRNQQARITQVEKSFGLPASLPVGETTPETDTDYVSWPLDLNAPVDKESVSKDVSFHNN